MFYLYEPYSPLINDECFMLTLNFPTALETLMNVNLNTNKN